MQHPQVQLHETHIPHTANRETDHYREHVTQRCPLPSQGEAIAQPEEYDRKAVLHKRKTDSVPDRINA